MTISPAFPYESRFVDVLGSRMHYVESGDGAPILFVHGNPTSSYLWRNVIPHVADQGRAIAVDLIGMGRSDKPAIGYRFVDHLRYLDAFIEALDLHDVTLVLHDWGGGLGVSWARRNADRVRAIALMEAVLTPVDWSDATVAERVVFGLMRTERIGNWMNMRHAFFLDRLMPMMIERTLTQAERAAYAAPYPTPESRRPVAVWPREIPFSGQPADLHAEIGQNFEWFATSPIPKLLLHASPGVIFKPAQVAQVRAEVDGLQTVHVGAGRHYLQEDQPDAIGGALAAWLRSSVATPRG